MFEDVVQGSPDPMYDLKIRADGDTSPDKVDLGVGIYRNEQGNYHELEAVKAAKIILDERKLGHDYEVTTGNSEFLDIAGQLVFGKDNEALKSGQIASVQTISGTGANHLAALLLARTGKFENRRVYLGTPAWGNYEPLCTLVGLEIVKYPYYDPKTSTVNFEVLMNTVKEAPRHSVFILQGCCHNPTGIDLSREQWKKLAHAMKDGKLFPFFDIAYQGLGDSLDEDAYPIRLYTEMGFEMVVCQSFSKNFGIYGERCGALHVVCPSKEIASNVHDQLRCLIRWEFSSSPAYGARLVKIIMESSELHGTWEKELTALQSRLSRNRELLYSHLKQTTGNWEDILASKGLFCFLPLSPEQCKLLRSKHHIYLPDNGRINISGLNEKNVARTASAIISVL